MSAPAARSRSGLEGPLLGLDNLTFPGPGWRRMGSDPPGGGHSYPGGDGAGWQPSQARHESADDVCQLVGYFRLRHVGELPNDESGRDDPRVPRRQR